MQLHRAGPDIEAAGARLVLIGNGGPSFIAGFRERTGYDGEIYTDPSLAAFKALGLRRGVGATFNPKGIGAAVRALRSGARQTGTKGDPWQQGGVFVVDTEGNPTLSFRSRHPGDHPRVDDIIDAVRRVQA